jgi:hypothetical protein
MTPAEDGHKKSARASECIQQKAGEGTPIGATPIVSKPSVAMWIIVNIYFSNLT